MATPKQEKLIKLLLENIGGKESSKSLAQMLKKAGYSESIQKNPYLILKSDTIKKAVAPVAKQIDNLRNKAIKELENRDLSEEQYRDIVKAIDIFTKNHQLLTGEETERQGVSINVIDSFDGDNNTV